MLLHALFHFDARDFDFNYESTNVHEGLLAAAYGFDGPNKPKKKHFCDDDDVKNKCAGYESRWTLQREIIVRLLDLCNMHVSL